jgi:hypothetical protein
MGTAMSKKPQKLPMPHIDTVLARTLESVEQRLAAEEVCPPLADHQAQLAATLEERRKGFEALAQRASERLLGLDNELAVDEEQLRKQIADMEAFRHKLTNWVDCLSAD